MRVLYLNNCWFTNVGEAFIDIGAMQLLKALFPKASIANFSCMSSWYTKYTIDRESKLRKDEDHNYEVSKIALDMSEYLSADIVVLAGMFAVEEMIHSDEYKMLLKMKSEGTKIIFIGMGGLLYNETERSVIASVFKELQPIMVTTRDWKAYELYKDEVEYCLPAIDCALWVKDVYNPTGFTKKEYDIVCFNRSKEPEEVISLDAVRPYHFGYFYKTSDFKTQQLVSDTPYDYLSIYANARKVYTDMVHATLISLMYQVPVKYYFIDQRSYTFEALHGIKKDDNGFLSLSEMELEKQKEEIIRDMKLRIDSFI